MCPRPQFLLLGGRPVDAGAGGEIDLDLVEFDLGLGDFRAVGLDRLLDRLVERSQSKEDGGHDRDDEDDDDAATDDESALRGINPISNGATRECRAATRSYPSDQRPIGLG